MSEAPAGITVTGHGVALAVPTLARVQFGAFVDRPRLADSLNGTNALVGRIRAALDEFGVAREDAVTGHLTVHYQQHDGIYHSGHTIDVTVRELSRVGELLTAVLLGGGDGALLHGVSFDVADRGPLVTEARQLAWADAQARAEQLAGHAGRRLGVVTAVTEPDTRFRAMATQEMFLMSAAGDGEPVDVEPGTVPVAVDLNVTWSFA